MSSRPVPEVHQLRPHEAAEAQAAFAELLRLSTTQETLGRQSDGVELDIGRVLAVLTDANAFRVLKDQSRQEWLSENLRIEGKPVTENMADRLIRETRMVIRFPTIEHVVRNGLDGERVCCRAAAYFACRIAVEDKWIEKEVQSYLESHKPLTERVVSDAQVHARESVDSRLIEILKRRSVREIREDYYVLRNDLRRAKGEILIEWVSIKGSIPRMVKEKADTVMVRAGLLTGDEVRPQSASLTQVFERLAGIGEDFLDAVDAYNDGNSKPLESLLKQGEKARR